MKLSSIFCASLAAGLICATAALAQSGASSSRGYIVGKGGEGVASPAEENDCTAKDGKVVTNKDGTKSCTVNFRESSSTEKTTTPAPATAPSPQ